MNHCAIRVINKDDVAEEIRVTDNVQGTRYKVHATITHPSFESLAPYVLQSCDPLASDKTGISKKYASRCQNL